VLSLSRSSRGWCGALLPLFPSLCISLLSISLLFRFPLHTDIHPSPLPSPSTSRSGYTSHSRPIPSLTTSSPRLTMHMHTPCPEHEESYSTRVHPMMSSYPTPTGYYTRYDARLARTSLAKRNLTPSQNLTSLAAYPERWVGLYVGPIGLTKRSLRCAVRKI
jgi:hypothetical protein